MSNLTKTYKETVTDINIKNIQSAIDYCKGKLVRLHKNLQPLPYERFDQNKYNSTKKKITHYEIMLKTLEIVRESK